ncbi:MAG: MltA domain-containing protein [Paracoccaceae bacterium]
MRPLSWTEIEGWKTDDHAAALAAFRVTADLFGMAVEDGADPRGFFEAHFEPVELSASEAHFTGYYEPEVPGALAPSDRFAHALYAFPAGIEPETPWFTRAEIVAGDKLAGLELVYLESAIEAFLAQVQGSIRVRLGDGTSLRLGFAGKNGHPYRSIGKELVARGVAPAARMTPEVIRDWCAHHPEAVQTLLNTNPSFVFFRPLDLPEEAVRLARWPFRSRRGAVWPSTRIVPLGSPVWIAAPSIGARRIAQDIGSAIRGARSGRSVLGLRREAGRTAGALNERRAHDRLRRRREPPPQAFPGRTRSVVQRLPRPRALRPDEPISAEQSRIDPV